MFSQCEYGWLYGDCGNTSNRYILGFRMWPTMHEEGRQDNHHIHILYWREAAGAASLSIPGTIYCITGGQKSIGRGNVMGVGGRWHHINSYKPRPGTLGSHIQDSVSQGSGWIYESGWIWGFSTSAGRRGKQADTTTTRRGWVHNKEWHRQFCRDSKRRCRCTTQNAPKDTEYSRKDTEEHITYDRRQTVSISETGSRDCT